MGLSFNYHGFWDGKAGWDRSRRRLRAQGLDPGIGSYTPLPEVVCGSACNDEGSNWVHHGKEIPGGRGGEKENGGAGRQCSGQVTGPQACFCGVSKALCSQHSGGVRAAEQQVRLRDLACRESPSLPPFLPP